MRLNNVIITLIMLILWALPACADELRFAVISDTHLMRRDGSFHLYPATERIVSTITGKLKPDFVLHCGDMIGINEKYDNRQAILSMWNLFNGGVRDRITSSGIPFFPAPGNHDVYGRGRDIYRQTWGTFANRGITLESGSYAGCYAFSMKGTLFIVLDGSGISLSEEQYSWLKGLLRKERGRTFVFSHVGLSGNGRHPGDYIRGSLGSILEKSRVDFFISGHQHKAAVEKGRAMCSISAGSAGETEPYNYLYFIIKDDKVEWKILKAYDCSSH